MTSIDDILDKMLHNIRVLIRELALHINHVVFIPCPDLWLK
jgi:hypothetical protein